jgi:hypothetical protein
LVAAFREALMPDQHFDPELQRFRARRALERLEAIEERENQRRDLPWVGAIGACLIAWILFIGFLLKRVNAAEPFVDVICKAAQ